ncbi:3-hydroxy-acyl-(acyl-carrier-protein) dehydratase [Candidatus Xenohaliotis californiensis]|uniref:3-hydroxyacyl-[acyl-carrier-protein] dehydratase FabZ n=1 Tax=Candidatus Xenohaliotis californiensis TaxID=84677 RepID=A0ABP0EW15_9RICK|nr:3-hydroxy-acyl-(acyl-carrier-protein) dehydratase [Candidatus Xenohaliotis californiensis]
MQNNTLYDISKIMGLLQHRYPMLLIDKIISATTQKIIAIKNVSINEPFFMGHFPKNPIMPGVLIIEAMAQAAGAGTMILKNMQATNNSICYFSSIDKAKFRKPVIPGDILRIEVDIVSNKSGFFKFDCTAKTNDQIATEASIKIFFKY